MQQQGVSLILAFAAVLTRLIPCATGSSPYFSPDVSTSLDPSPRVVLELFVMSKCPDAAKCQLSFLPAVVESLGGYDGILDVRQSFIAESKPSRPFGVACMHDDSECEGDAAQLCIEKHLSGKLFQFLGEVGKDQSSIPGNTEASLRAVGAPASTISRVLSCASGQEGKALLVKSASRAQSMGVVMSCSMFLQDKLVCSVGDGEWLDCSIKPNAEHWIKAICNAYVKSGGRSHQLPRSCRGRSFLEQEGHSLMQHHKSANAECARTTTSSDGAVDYAQEPLEL